MNGEQSGANVPARPIGDLRVRCSGEFLLREIGGESVLVPLVSDGPLANSVISLNESCRFLWDFFRDAHTVREAVEAARETYEDPEGRMEPEIVQTVLEYLRYGLLLREEEIE